MNLPWSVKLHQMNFDPLTFVLIASTSAIGSEWGIYSHDVHMMYTWLYVPVTLRNVDHAKERFRLQVSCLNLAGTTLSSYSSTFKCTLHSQARSQVRWLHTAGGMMWLHTLGNLIASFKYSAFNREGWHSNWLYLDSTHQHTQSRSHPHQTVGRRSHCLCSNLEWWED